MIYAISIELNTILDMNCYPRCRFFLCNILSHFLNQVIYKIKLPGPAILGEGKPENQNHAIIFTRGEGLQTIDMNQV